MIPLHFLWNLRPFSEPAFSYVTDSKPTLKLIPIPQKMKRKGETARDF